MRTPFLLATVLATGVLSSAFGQNTVWGPRLGVDLGAQSVGSVGQNVTDWKPGFLFGIAGDRDFRNGLHLATELLWIQKGSSTRNPSIGTKGLTTLNYLEADILGKFDLSGDAEGLFLTIGPTFAYFLNGKVKNLQDGKETSSYKVSGSQLDKRFEVGAAVGVGFDLKNWVMEFRGQTGFTSIDTFSPTRNAVLSIQFTRYLWGSKD